MDNLIIDNRCDPERVRHKPNIFFAEGCDSILRMFLRYTALDALEKGRGVVTFTVREDMSWQVETTCWSLPLLEEEDGLPLWKRLFESRFPQFQRSHPLTTMLPDFFPVLCVSGWAEIHVYHETGHYFLRYEEGNRVIGPETLPPEEGRSGMDICFLPLYAVFEGVHPDVGKLVGDAKLLTTVIPGLSVGFRLGRMKLDYTYERGLAKGLSGIENVKTVSCQAGAVRAEVAFAPAGDYLIRESFYHYTPMEAGIFREQSDRRLDAAVANKLRQRLHLVIHILDEGPVFYTNATRKSVYLTADFDETVDAICRAIREAQNVQNPQ